MRMATDPSDPGYHVWNRTRRRAIIRVYVDGVRLSDCVMADTKRRIALIADRDEDGLIALTSRGARVKLRQLTGSVRIEIARRPTRASPASSETAASLPLPYRKR